MWRDATVKQATYRGVVKGQTVLLEDWPAPLVDGTEVLVTPVNLQAGTPAALVAAMESEPHMTREDVAELEKAIARGRLPLSSVDPFPEMSGESGAPE
jgi:hypothetical protein